MVNKITLVVPVFAEANLVENMLNSISNLEVKPDNLVLVDDRHSRETSNVLENFATHYFFPVQLKVNDRNLGICQSTHVGLRDVMTKYVGFLDSDDLLTADAVKRFKKQNANFKVYSSNYSIFSSDKDLKSAVEYPRKYSMEIMNLKSNEWQKAILFENLISHFKVVKTSLTSEFSWDNKYDGIQDLLLNYSLNLTDRVLLDDVQTYFHRIHNKQTTNAISNASKSLKLLNEGRIHWRNKLGYKRNANIENDNNDLFVNLFTEFGNTCSSIFFSIARTGEKHFLHFNESAYELSSQVLIGCFLGDENDDFFLRRALLNIYPKSNVPIGLFLDARIEKHLNYLKYYSGLFDFVVLKNVESLSEIREFLPDEIQMFTVYSSS